MFYLLILWKKDYFCTTFQDYFQCNLFICSSTLKDLFPPKVFFFHYRFDWISDLLYNICNFLPKIMNMLSEIFHRLVLVLHFWSKLWRLHWPLQSRALTWDHMFVGSSINLKNLSVLGTKMQNNISFLWKTNKKSLVLQVRFLFLLFWIFHVFLWRTKSVF